MGEGDEDIDGGEAPKISDIRKGGSEKIVGLGGGFRKSVYYFVEWTIAVSGAKQLRFRLKTD